MAPELRELAAERSGTITMRDYLSETGRDVEDIYTDTVGGWTTLRRRARLADGDDEETENRKLGWLLHIDEQTRLAVYRRCVSDKSNTDPTTDLSALDRSRLQMLDSQLWERGEMPLAEETIRKLAERPAIAAELRELTEVLAERITVAAEIFPVPGWALSLHHQYRQREILAAVGFVSPGQRKKAIQGGILKLDETRCELLFVTLDKSGSDSSPTTRYKDYAISRELFHWETQGAASVSRPSGRRYVESPGNGMSFHLFVRSTPYDAYAYLGPVKIHAHSGDRPIAITWRLEHPIPAGLFEKYATLATG